MAKIVLVLKLLGLSYLTYLLYALAFEYDPTAPSFSPPFLLWILDTINLFIHEAGHFFLRPFGRWIYMFGGSFTQVFLPLLLAFLGLRQSYRHTILPAFWCGESMVNVSVYIRDAPFRQLKLLAKGLTHDWNWHLSDNLDSAGTLADIVFGLGILLCAGAIGAGVYAAIQAFREGSEVESELPIPARIERKKVEEER
jgi:hypothetical protein